MERIQMADSLWLRSRETANLLIGYQALDEKCHSPQNAVLNPSCSETFEGVT